MSFEMDDVMVFSWGQITSTQVCLHPSHICPSWTEGPCHQTNV